MPLPHEQLDASFRKHTRLLWGLSYRMTGSAADADEIVQETFVRALADPPADLDRSLRPWLVKVATRLSLDALRRRKARPYVGPWLPEPVEVADDPDDVPGARYERLESVTLAFLRALEALNPKERAVLLLRDVMDYSVREAAEALALTEGHVKVLHHRARARLASYDADRAVVDEDRVARTRAALEQLLAAMLSSDVEAMERLLADGVEAVQDSAGAFKAARKPIVGKARVALFYQRIRRLYPAEDPNARFEVRVVNALPAFLLQLGHVPAGSPPRQLMSVHLDTAGRIRCIQSHVAPDKLAPLFD
jgi:RNA polymerase sigma factor (sigma-70 family)